jgi:gamma-glutamyltranspeptidase
MEPFSAHCVTVPGACALWVDAQAALGRLDLATVLAPAIALAEDGFVVGPITAAAWAEEAERLRRASPNGHELLHQGEVGRTDGRTGRTHAQAPAYTAHGPRCMHRPPSQTRSCGCRRWPRTAHAHVQVYGGPMLRDRSGGIPRTLREVARSGTTDFYTGRIARAIVDVLRGYVQSATRAFAGVWG